MLRGPAILACLLACAPLACTRPRRPTATATATAASHAASHWQLDRSTFDPSASPCTDFYQYVCGGFATVDHIPASRGDAQWATDQVDAANQRAINELLAGRTPSRDPEVARLRTFYASCMESERDRTAAATLDGELAHIANIATRDDVMTVVRALQRDGIPVLFEYSGEPDPKDNTRYRAAIDRGAIGHPRMYVDRGDGADARREAYRAHVAAMLALSGEPVDDARRDANVIFAIDAALAAAVAHPADPWDDAATEHPFTADELARTWPHLAWPAWFALADRPDDAINVTSPTYLDVANAVVGDRPLAELRAYLRWQLLHGLGPALPRRLADEAVRFAANGVARGDRTDDCRLATLEALGVELSHQFSLSVVGVAARDAARPVVAQIDAAIARAVGDEPWLSEAARATTRRKIAALALEVGFPDTWPPRGDFALAADTFLDNVLAARRFEQQRSWAQVGQRHRDTWQDVVYPNAAPGIAAARLTIPNGYPDLMTNSILLTAAYLRPPLFDAAAPIEVQLATFGNMVAHEIIHVVEEHDYDERGERTETWTPADIAAHEGRRACVVDQANAFAPFPDAHLDGKQTYTENVADLGAVRFAFATMAASAGPLDDRGADGLTRAQRFFVAYAQHWCSAQRPDVARVTLRDDPHAPERFRVDFPLANLAEFARAFRCAPDAAMNRGARRCEVW